MPIYVPEIWLKVSKNDLRKKSGLWYFLPYIYIHKKYFEFCLKFYVFQFCYFYGFLNHKCSRNMVKSGEKTTFEKKLTLTFFTLYIHTYEKIRVLPKIWHFPILLFLGFLTHICSRNMVKSVEKRPSKKSGLWHSLPYIYTYDTNKLRFCLKSDIFQFCYF